VLDGLDAHTELTQTIGTVLVPGAHIQQFWIEDLEAMTA